MKRLSCFFLVFVAMLFVGADKKESKPSSTQIQQWIKQLGDKDYTVREEATRDLIKARGAALDAVTMATKSEDAEVRQRALRIFKQIDKQLEKEATAYFNERGCNVTIYEKSLGSPVTSLSLQNINDDGLVYLKRLAGFQVLSLPPSITDGGLEHLRGFTELQELTLYGTKVTDTGLIHLKGLINLNTLVLGGTKITDSGLVHLKRLTKLQELWLTNTKITEAGLLHLKGLTNLRALHLDFKITATGLVKLKGLTNLQKLDLSTDLSDSGLVHLRCFTNLVGLNLNATKITDIGLVHLEGLTSLKQLHLTNTKVTQAGIEKLRKALPGCEIYWGSGEELGSP